MGSKPQPQSTGPKKRFRAAPTSKNAPLRQLADEEGIPYSTAYQAALAREFTALRLGRAGSRRLAIYADRGSFATWLQSKRVV